MKIEAKELLEDVLVCFKEAKIYFLLSLTTALIVRIESGSLFLSLWVALAMGLLSALLGVQSHYDKLKNNLVNAHKSLVLSFCKEFDDYSHDVKDAIVRMKNGHYEEAEEILKSVHSRNNEVLNVLKHSENVNGNQWKKPI
jgi:hypothetical protein